MLKVSPLINSLVINSQDPSDTYEIEKTEDGHRLIVTREGEEFKLFIPFSYQHAITTTITVPLDWSMFRL